MINHLGKGSFWSTFSPSIQKYNYLSPLSNLHFNKILRILLMSGIIYNHHLFFCKRFLKLLIKFSLPIYFDKNTYVKFYREVRLKITINQGGKKVFYIRKLFQILNISEIIFFKKNQTTLVTLMVQLPVPFKRIFKKDKKKFVKKFINLINYSVFLKNLIIWKYKF